MNPENHYTERLSLTKGQLQQVKKQIFRISMLRLTLFIAGVAGIYFFFSQTPLLIVCICLTFLPLFILVKIHNHFFIRKEWLETQARIIQEELQALSGDYSSFEDGKEYVNPEHPYSFDLDIFGRRSLFQSINRTCTFSEKPVWQNGCKTICTKKLPSKNGRNGTGNKRTYLVPRTVPHSRTGTPWSVIRWRKIQAWSQSPAQYLHAGWVKAFIWGVPVINSLLLITSLIGWTSFSCLGLSFGIFLVLSFGIIKRATYIQETYGKQLKSLNGYARLIALAKAEDWKSAGMLELMERFNLNGQSPVQALQQLSKELDRLDLRNNQFLYVLLEGSIFSSFRKLSA